MKRIASTALTITTLILLCLRPGRHLAPQGRPPRPISPSRRILNPVMAQSARHHERSAGGDPAGLADHRLVDAYQGRADLPPRGISTPVAASTTSIWSRWYPSSSDLGAIVGSLTGGRPPGREPRQHDQRPVHRRAERPTSWRQSAMPPPARRPGRSSSGQGRLTRLRFRLGSSTGSGSGSGELGSSGS